MLHHRNVILGALTFFVLFSLVIVFIVVFGGSKEEPPAADQGLGSELFEKVENPAAKLPQTNPLENSPNPFEQGETNPFRESFNPFE